MNSPAAKTVLSVIDALNVGGAQELLVLLARNSPPGVRFVVCSLQDDQTMADRLRQAGAEVHVLGRERPSLLQFFRFASYLAGGLRDLARLCASIRPDVIHCHLSDAVFLGFAASFFYKGSRVMLTKHTPVLFPERSNLDPRNLLRKAAVLLIYRNIRYIAAVSEEIRRNLLQGLGLSRDRVVTIPNGVEIPASARGKSEAAREALDLAPNETVILTVGRLVPVKGQTYLIEAMARLVDRYPTLTLLIAGEGPCRNELEKRIEDLGLIGRVRLLGYRKEVLRLYDTADVVVFPSLSEGTSLAIIEAMAAGRPIVATSLGGNLDLLQHKHTALLVRPEDAESLAEAVAQCMADPALATRLGGAARRKALAEHGIERTVAAYAALWSN